MSKALITCMHLARHFEDVRLQYEQFGVEPFIPPLSGQQFSSAEMAKLVVGMDIVIAGDDSITADVINAGRESRLQAIIKWGIGTDSIDKMHAASIGLPVYNTPGVFGDEVADLALAHLLMLTRKLHLMDRSVRDGGWLKVDGRSLVGSMAGVIGLGSIGRAIARRASAFGMTVVGTDIVSSNVADTSPSIQLVPLADMLEIADVVFVACALNSENRHLLGRQQFASMKPGALVINVARGPLIDETALAEALASGHIAGAGLDVFEEEPLPESSPLRAVVDRCTLSTHSGSNTYEAVARINQMTTDILLDVLGLKAAGFEPNRVA